MWEKHKENGDDGKVVLRMGMGRKKVGLRISKKEEKIMWIKGWKLFWGWRVCGGRSEEMRRRKITQNKKWRERKRKKESRNVDDVRVRFLSFRMAPLQCEGIYNLEFNAALLLFFFTLMWISDDDFPFSLSDVSPPTLVGASNEAKMTFSYLLKYITTHSLDSWLLIPTVERSLPPQTGTVITHSFWMRQQPQQTAHLPTFFTRSDY